MENKKNPDLIRGIAIAEENHERTMDNQINFYKEALKNAQNNSNQPTTHQGHHPQNNSSDGQNPLTKDSSSNNPAKKETMIDIFKKWFRKLFPSSQK
ncbi:hypothetical protein IEO70_04255 [Bacillus sp. AGMB 02131]|uniref:Uncharacterized protein n=1 Tax=Peribacillus faecalis TaxID=2772559 RepID=A0A927H9G5_9BACI|nr:hypothetical protein [Peribacillus faecalis]MBD3107570.1 hypothetical protein [Peribacillus faecalis]